MKKLILILPLLLLFAACSGGQTPAAPAEESAGETDEVTLADEPAVIENNLTSGCVENYEDGVDYFPQKVEITQATNFSVEYFNNYKVVTILSPFVGAESGISYVLVQCGTPAPEGVEAAAVIEVPINSIVAMSTTYLPGIQELGVLDKVVGVDTAAFTTNQTVVEGVAAGNIAEIGSGAQVNVEAAIDLDPDLIMTYGSGSADFDSEPKLREAGLDVVLNAEFLETSPLGRAEWVDYLALFYNEEAASEAWFDGVVNAYTDLQELAATAEAQPTVFTDTPFEGTWYMSGGGSFAAQLLADAGASYVYADDEQTGSLFLDFETVLNDASETDFWLNVGFYGSLDDLSGADGRFTEFAAYQNDRVFNNDAKLTANGGNDYFEGAVIRPDLVLADLIAIFHPELLPDHELVYYRQLQ
ncbi:MAG: ABC transporter substrate-binding protein [Ardenticatenaceae bacterium]|nr:ABC transporter substrate-binding protein [Ardenticatenaceae bacterium]